MNSSSSATAAAASRGGDAGAGADLKLLKLETTFLKVCSSASQSRAGCMMASWTTAAASSTRREMFATSASSRSTCTAASVEARAASSEAFCRLTTIGRTSCSNRLAISPTCRAARNAAVMTAIWVAAIASTPNAIRPSNRSVISEDADANIQILLGVRLDRGYQAAHVVDRGVQLVVHLSIVQEQPHRALPLLERRGNLVEPLAHRIEAVVQLLIGEQLARRALATIQFPGERVEIRSGRGERLRHRIVVEQLPE